MKRTLLFIIGLILLASLVSAVPEYRPYIHEPAIPERPEVKLYGQYQTQLFPGSGTYSYPLIFPPGTHGLQPSLAVTYSSQSMTSKPGVLGAGWSLSQNFILRDVNGTVTNRSDDEFILFLNGNSYELASIAPNEWRTEVDEHFKVENLTGAPNNNSMYWVVHTPDGTRYQFGYYPASELTANTHRNYTVKWHLDEVKDTFDNIINYTYLENPYAEDNGTAYLSEVVYNNERSRKITFSYGDLRADRRVVFEQGNAVLESRKLSDIHVFANDVLVRRYRFVQANISQTVSTLTNVLDYGADNVSVWYNISFDYWRAEAGYTLANNWKHPINFTNSGSVELGVRHLDIDGDGFVDVVKGYESDGERKAWLNNRTGGWTLDATWQPPEYISGTVGQDKGVRFADANLDGLSDLLFSRQGVSKVYLNTGAGWSLNTAWTIPLDFTDGTTDQGVEIDDVNGDGKADLVRGKTGDPHQVYLNTGKGWQEAPEWAHNFTFVDALGSENGTRLVDINGDGLIDAMHSTATGVGVKRAFLNTGAGWEEYNQSRPPVTFELSDGADNGIRLVDVNGDGLTDIWQYKGVDRHAWLNTGNGWIQNDSWWPPYELAQAADNLGARIADVNGDGMPDVLVSDSTNNLTYVKNFALPFVLKKIVNEYGGNTLVNYTSALHFNHTDVDGRLGFPMYVVVNVTTDNNVTGDFNAVAQTLYNYSLGKFNYQKRDFRGFGVVVEKKPSANVWHYFHQTDALKGKEYATEVDGENNPFSVVRKGFTVTTHSGVYNVSLLYSSDYLHDNATANPKVTNQTFRYDEHGNVVGVYNDGEVNVSGDERVNNFTYAKNTREWIVNRVARTTQYDESWNRIKESYFYYDGTGLHGNLGRGALTKKEFWNNDGNNSFVSYEYDTFGNVMKETDANANSMMTAYDGTHTFPVTTINALGHVMTAEYDFGTGNILTQTKNDIATHWEYDTFGRVLKEIQPLDSVALPTKSYTYSFDGRAPEVVLVRSKTTANKTDNARFYYDGFAQLVQIKTDVEAGRQVVKNLFYDKSGRVSSEQNPYFTSYTTDLTVASADPKTNYTYDPMDRVIGVRNADGTNKNISFQKWNISDMDENRHNHTYQLDAHGQIVVVYEHFMDPIHGRNETFKTTYGYDDNGNLVKITDSVGNVFSFIYDSLSRKTKMIDPDLGAWVYRYDGAGNLITQNDSRNKQITLIYDELNRVVNKNSTDDDVVFGYDRDYSGTLSNITMQTANSSYEYDDRFRVVKETKVVDGASFVTTYTYDAQNRLVSKEGLGTDLDFVFNSQGKVKSVPNYINDSHYNAFGSIVNRTYANGLVTSFTYNANNNRVTNIVIPSVQNLQYTYDDVGNILTINDAVQSRLHTLSYDSLDRMIKAVVGPDRWVYSYNPTGNIMKIVKNDAAKKMVYAGSQAHAPSQIVEEAAGADVHGISANNTHSKVREYEFFVLNDKNTSINVNWTVNFASGNTSTGLNVNVPAESYTRVTAQNNYSSAGNYVLNFSTISAGAADYEPKSMKFGAQRDSLGVIWQNDSRRIFEFVVDNDVSEQLLNAQVSCSDGLSSTNRVNVSGNATLFSFIQHNFTSSGSRTFNCSVLGQDGNTSQTLDVDVKDLEIELFDVLFTNTSQRTVAFDVKNYYHPLSTLINVTIGNEVTAIEYFSTTQAIGQDQVVMVFAQVNHTRDDVEPLLVSASSGGLSNVLRPALYLEGVNLVNYTRNGTNDTARQLVYYLFNSWVSGGIQYNVSDPSSSNTQVVNSNQSFKVTVSSNYTAGLRNLQITARIRTFVDRIADYFKVEPLQIERVSVLSENSTSAVTEFVVRNNLGGQSQTFTWTFDSGVTNTTTNGATVTNTTTLNITSHYSSAGVYKTQVRINSSGHADNQSSVVIVS